MDNENEVRRLVRNALQEESNQALCVTVGTQTEAVPELEEDVLRVARRPRLVPLKNPLDAVPKLTEEHFRQKCMEFYMDMERNFAEDEARFERTIQLYREEVKGMRCRVMDAYKNLFQLMLNNVYDEDKKEMLEAIGLMIEHPEYSECFAEIMKNAVRFINEGKRPALIHDTAQYVYGTKPLYFDFDDFDGFD